MKKLIVLALLTNALLLAAENSYYVGFDGGITGVVFKTSIPSLDFYESERNHGSSETLKIGYYINKNNRVNGFFQQINGADAKVYGIAYDYLIGSTPFKPFLGGLIGHASFKDDGDDTTPTTHLSGNVYGLQAGVNYTINEKLSVEAGARYLRSYADQTMNTSGSDVTFKIDPIHNLFIGANYKFSI